MQTKLAHIINPVKMPKGADLEIALPITFETFKQAKNFSEGKLEIELFSISYAEDHVIIPDFFKKLPDLTRSVQDMGSFSSKKKLPLIADILKGLYESTDAEWLIYTNADICLMPHFYLAINEMIAEGYDSILINRRRISKKYDSISQIPLMYSDIGGPHPGYDCFVFHRSLFNKFIFDGICIGIPFIEVSFLHNLIAFSSSLKLADDQHLTFHIGMEVMPPVDKELYQYNRAIFENQIKPKLKPHLQIQNFPYSQLPFSKRLIKWILNPCYSTALVLELENKRLFRKIKMIIDEWRWRYLSK